METVENADYVSGRKQVLARCKQITTAKVRQAGKPALRP